MFRLTQTCELRTERLLLRPWRDSDEAPFAKMNADPRVMEHYPEVLTREQSDEFVLRIRKHFDQHGFGLWAVELADEPFIGFVGLQWVPFQAHFTPCVEIGWRLAAQHWHRGYAVEAAREALRFGFEQLALDEIVAMTVPANHRSLAVMKRLGMSHNEADDFDHPRLAEGHRLRRHVLYRIGRIARTARTGVAIA